MNARPTGTDGSASVAIATKIKRRSSDACHWRNLPHWRQPPVGRQHQNAGLNLRHFPASSGGTKSMGTVALISTGDPSFTCGRKRQSLTTKPPLRNHSIDGKRCTPTTIVGTSVQPLTPFVESRYRWIFNPRRLYAPRTPQLCFPRRDSYASSRSYRRSLIRPSLRWAQDDRKSRRR